MAGPGKYPSLLIDPAVEKWAHMKENTPYYFQFNKKTTKAVAFYLLIVPGILYYGLQKYQVSFLLTSLNSICVDA
jgi:hypothetical protein